MPNTIPVLSNSRDEYRKGIREYYSESIKASADLKTNACCIGDGIPEKHRSILAEIPGEILEKFYGCGSPIPDALDGTTILDLGCGTGRDAYLLSRLVGPKGKVIGVDMTAGQLEVARKHLPGQMERWGYVQANLEFREGYIEDLLALGLADESVDIVVSNCVINLSPDKPRVFQEIFRVLKPGGELYFSDVLSGKRIPASLLADPVLQGECLAGAMYIEDFRRLLRDIGCLDYRVLSKRRLEIGNADVERKVGMVDFYSMTLRAFKLPEHLEDICEDYGQVATYLGTAEGLPHGFTLDDHHFFPTGKPCLVCGNTAAMLAETRFGRHFRIDGDRKTHYGAFACASPATVKSAGDAGGGACC